MTPLTMQMPGATRPLTDRRRRPRLTSRTQGWVIPANRTRLPYVPADDDLQEVWIENLSRNGVGFISGEPMPIGIEQQIRVGRGPMTRCKSMRVVFCQKLDENVYRIGVEFMSAAQMPLAKAG